ncbi:MAG: hypothetical protein KBS95_07410 [Alistipes sp.]|nr:hypothetical protein [Candidatus Alistipes equi]
MNEKINRIRIIEDLIKSGTFTTQDHLQQKLAELGIEVTQATLSRDIKEIGATKITDHTGVQKYALRKFSQIKSNLHLDNVEISGQLCVLHCQPGFASAVASVVDGAHIEAVMGTITGDDTVMVMLRLEANQQKIREILNTLFDISDIMVRIATEADTKFANDIVNEIYISSLERKTGIAQRTPEYICEKILAGKAVIATSSNDQFAGFSYIESWGEKKYVANSGLIVAHRFRGMGIAKRIKELTFQLSRTLFPEAKIFSITTGAAVMKMNYQFGFRPVPFTELTDDPEFWKGCEGCRHFDILKSHEYKMCICTGLLYEPNGK